MATKTDATPQSPSSLENAFADLDELRAANEKAEGVPL